MATVSPIDVIDDVHVVHPTSTATSGAASSRPIGATWFPGGREMIQGNRADRRAGSIVGLHYHLHQADYWYVPFGRARVVLHDLRAGSARPTAPRSPSTSARTPTAAPTTTAASTSRPAWPTASRR